MPSSSHIPHATVSLLVGVVWGTAGVGCSQIDALLSHHLHIDSDFHSNTHNSTGTGN